MRITRLSIDQTTAEAEKIPHLSMHRLGQIVALAGANGAGKTRILEYINTRAHAALKAKQEHSICQLEITRLKSFSPERKRDSHQTRIDALEEKQARLSKDMSIADFSPEEPPELIIMKFRPQPHSIPSIFENTPTGQFDAIYGTARSRDTSKIHTSALPYIYKVTRNYWDATHPASNLDPEEKKAHILEHDLLLHNVEKFLGERLTANNSGEP